MTAPISNGPTTHGYTTMRDATGFTVAECCALCAKKFALRGLMWGEREKVRPACSKWPTIGVLWRAGRSFSWSCCGTGVSGDLCRGPAAAGVPLGDFVLPRSRVHHAPLDLGLAPAPTCRAHQPPGPSASGPSSHPSTAFPRDFSHFAENATHPYI